MLLDFDRYFDPEAPIKEIHIAGIDYPIGDLYGTEIHFMHYKTFDEAVYKWREICRRINKDSLYLIMTDRDGCTLEDMKAFDDLDYRNKVLFTNKKYPEIKCAFYVKGFENEKSVGQLQTKMSITGKRYIDQFDYVEFLNRQ